MFQSLGSPGLNTSEALLSKKMNCRSWGFARNCSVGRKHNVMSNLFSREVHGTPIHRLNNPFGDYGTPKRLRMPIEDIIPASALEAGNIFMGFTNCGRYLVSYTCRPTEHFGVFDSDATYMYTLHIWLFTPYTKIKKVSQVCLFDNNGVYDNNLLIEISQWDLDDDHLLITGHSVNSDSESHHTFYSTITTIPGTKNCPNCVYMHDEELEEDMANSSRLRTNCIVHGLTLHLKYDHVSPYPRLNSDVQLRFKDSVLLNTGNVIHMVSYRLIRPTPQIPGKMEAPSLVPRAGAMISTKRVPLRCDVWLKLPNLNMGALRTVNKFIAQEFGKDGEENKVSLNNLERLLLFIQSTTNNTKQVGTALQQQQVAYSEGFSSGCRRLSQSSTDSDSLFSPKSASFCECMPPMSPPFLNKPRSPRQNDNPCGAQVKEENLNVSPSKLMLPPQERKFFKRRLSSQSLVSPTCSTPSTNSSVTNDVQPDEKNVEAPKASPESPTKQSESAFDVFEMRFEDIAVEKQVSSFKTFRKRRLADKKYEFKDADVSAENIVPLKMTRRNKPKYCHQLQGNSGANPRSPRNENENTTAGSESPRGAFGEVSHPRSPRAYHIMSPIMSPNYNYDSSISDVLRPLNNNFSKVKVPALSPSNNLGGLDMEDIGKFKEDDLCKEFKDNTSQFASQGLKKVEADHPHMKPTLSVNVNCIAKVLRSYIQKDDDNMSVITDIEDEMCQGYPFPVALPLDVHGAGYQQLQMISNSKAEKFHVPVVQVLQRTLDVEMLCNEMANYMCLASDKHYCSCMDFDLAFAEANPDRGTVVAVVVMLVQATTLKQKNRIERTNTFYHQELRKKYEALFVCEWTPCREHCRVLYNSSLRELDLVPDPWHPTENMEAAIKTHSKICSPKKTLSNALAVHDWQSLDELVDAYGIVALIKDEGSTDKTDRRLNDYTNILSFENTIDPASVTSTTTDSDDEWGM